MRPARSFATIALAHERRKVLVNTYAERRDRLIEIFRRPDDAPIGLAKSTSNLFRDRITVRKKLLDVRAFNHVLRVEREAAWVETEGMTSYEDLVAATLPHGTMPAVVPQLKSITIGGALAGVGIEATSFRHGLVHETVEEFDVLTGDGRIVTCTAQNDHRELYYGFPNSYGTLGYALRIKARTIPVSRYVRLEHRRFGDAESYFHSVANACRSDADFVDGVVFDSGELFLTEARFVENAPYTSDYTYEHIYYRSIREKSTDYLTAADFLWRWDTDWFWCSRNLYAQNPLVRRLYGRSRLNSRTYTQIMRWNSRWGLTRVIDRFSGVHPESVIQDVDIPIGRAPEFLDFFRRQIGILPVWICPIGPSARSDAYSLYPIKPGVLYVNFGFWDVVRRREHHPAGHFNRLIEEKAAELGGIKSLYSDSFYPAEEFWRIYGGESYRRLKARYDPLGVFGDLYAKCVLRR